MVINNDYEQGHLIFLFINFIIMKEQHKEQHNTGFFSNMELVFALLSGLALGIGYLLSINNETFMALAASILAYFFGGFFTLKEAIKTIAKGAFEIDFLMFAAAVGAAILGKWSEGGLLLFLFSLGHALEHYALGKARKSIQALTDLAPPTALLLQAGKEVEIKIEELQLGDTIRIKPNSKVPADGVVVRGEGTVNQAPITGESIPVDKMAIDAPTRDYSKVKKIDQKNRVFAGTINGNRVLEVQVIKEAKDSTIARLIHMVNEVEEQKSPTQLLTDKFQRYFVPAVLLLVILLCFAFLIVDETFNESFYRAISVLVAASPCALAISTPSAVLSGVARAAKGGVLIKGGRPLEDLGILDAVAFDKTGTLTEGKPKLAELIIFDGVDKQEFYSTVLAVEQQSDHPLAQAIVNGINEIVEPNRISEAIDIESVTGKGVKGTIDNSLVLIGNKALFSSDDGNLPQDYKEQVETLEAEGKTVMLVKKGKDFLGIISVMDKPRVGAKETLAALRKLGIRRMIMLTGDNQQVANSIAKEIGLTDAFGDLMPEDKVRAVKQLTDKEGKVAMVGDGVNDAPAMVKSTVGIAMGAAGSDVALETADIALMADKLENLPFAIGLSRKSKAIIRQNLWISLGVVVLLIPLTMFELASIGPAIFAHEGSTLVVVLNALRLLAYKN